MGTSSKAKTNKAGVAKKPRAVLGASRGNIKGTTSSARSSTKTKAKAKIKGKSKAKSVKVSLHSYEKDEVAEPSYYPDGMLDFIDDNKLTFLEASILKRLVRLEYKDKKNDLKKLQMELGSYFDTDERTLEQVFSIASQWTRVVNNHAWNTMRALEGKEFDYKEYEKAHVSHYANRFVQALCMKNDLKWEMLNNLKLVLDNMERNLA